MPATTGTHEGGGAPARWGPAWAVALALLGLALRLVRLDAQSLWFDEAYSVAVSRLPFDQLVEALVADVRQAPLHFLLLAPWLELADGQMPVGALARLPSALASAAGIGFAWLLARRLFDGATATLAAALLAVSQLDVLYAQEARMYALFACLATAGAWLLARGVLDGSRGSFYGAAVLGALATLAHYYGVLVVAAWLVWAASVRRAHPVPLKRWFGAGAVGAALLLPWWLVGAARQAGRVGEVVPERVASWFAVDGLTALRTLNELDGGRLPSLNERPAAWAWIAGALLVGAPALLGAFRAHGGRRDAEARAAARLCALLVLVPLASALALGTAFRFQYATRYVLPCLAPYLALASRGLLSLRPPALRAAAIAGALALGLAGVSVALTDVHEAEWREALAHVAERRAPEDRCVFVPAARVPLQWGIYHPDLDPRAATVDEALGDAACDRVWLVAFERTPALVEEGRRAERELARAFGAVGERSLFRIRVIELVRR